MRVVIVNVLLGSALGLLLSTMGFSFMSWQYWAVSAVFLGGIVNSILRSHE